MANPTFNETGYMTLIANADTVQWPPSTEVDADIKVQGTGSNLDAIRNGATFTFTFGTAADMSATNTMPRVWFQHTFPSYLQTTALGGLQIGLTDGTNTAYWYVSGSDSHKGTWELLQCDPSATPDSGTAPTMSAITAMYIVMVHATAARNVDNTYIDISYFGIGIEFYGGTSGDKVTWATLASSDTGTTTDKWYGIIERIKGGAYYLNHAIYIGDSAATNNCYFDGTGETIVFYDANEKSGSYQIKATGNATGTTDIDLDGATIFSAATPFVFDMSAANLTTLSMVGTKLKNCSAASFKSTQSLSGITFEDTTAVNTNDGTLDACTFVNSTQISDTLEDVTNSSFTSGGTGHAVDLTGAGALTTQTMNWSNSDSGYAATDGSTGNETIKVNVASANTLTINVAAGATTPTIYNTGTGTVTVVAGQVTTLITVRDINTQAVIQGARVYLIAAAGGPLTEGTVIFNELTDVNGQVSDTRSLGSNQPVTGRVRKSTTTPFYKTSPISETIDNANGLTLNVALIPDE